MYKVLLIDDEPWILKDMEILIDWEEYGFDVVAKITDSEQAIYMIKKYHPDLILCDIRMPGLNGLELMKMVKQRFKDIFVVFISAYSEFDYAKQAIEMGAFDYILKPTDKDELVNTLKRVYGLLEKNKEENSILAEYKKTDVFLKLIEDKLDAKLIEDKIGELGYDLPFNYFFITVINTIDNNFGDRRWQQDFKDCFDDHRLIFIQLGEQKWAVLVNYKFASLSEPKNYLNNIRNLAQKNKILMGISDVFNKLTKIKRCYKQAELMSYNYFIYKKYGVYLYSQYNNNYKDLSFAIKELNSPGEFKEMLTKLPRLITDKNINIEELTYLYNQLREKANLLFKLEDEIQLLDSEDIVYSFNNLDQLVQQLIDFLKEVDNNDYNVSSDIVGQIIDEIQSNFDQDVKLQNLAEKYHVNYNYLSQLFKKETGQTFTNYLVELRIEKAIKLFSEDLLFYEIAKKVGYNDYYHFCKIFKKHKGLSPSEFKNMYSQ